MVLLHTQASLLLPCCSIHFLVESESLSINGHQRNPFDDQILRVHKEKTKESRELKIEGKPLHGRKKSYLHLPLNS